MAKIAAIFQLLDKNVTVSSHRLELLSPARDAAIAREAILHGADAVYIGGPGFGARHNASNSLKDIAELVPFAHRYGAKIFVTLNTILHDDELEPAQRLITDLYQTGVDALIVQDMGILELDIPPIELHASTQCDIRTVEKAKFLSDVGFTQIVLARELNLDQIRAIHQATDATIEFFIHGALCVAYSGQCYISHAQTGRSANRGDCSQACRLPYTLKDDQGRVVSYEKHLLSMKDNDQTANLGALIDAGVRSFKIEGRYKDMSYVKNITAHYRQMLDAIIEERGDLARASSGRTEHFFVPSTEKTFHRGSTDYFVNARKGDIGAFDSPKFIGLPGALFVPNSLLNQFRREAADMLDAARLASYQRGSRKPVADPAPVYPQTHLSFLANVYNQKAREFYHRYGVQLIDAAYEAHEEKGEVPVMITKHCLRFAFNLCPKQAKGNIKSWKATPMQLVNGDEVLTLKFDCRPCEMHVIGKIKNHILKMPLPGSVVASVSPDELLKTLPKRKG